MNKVSFNVRHSSNSGFTLVEILVVLAIIGLLAGLIGPQVMKQFSSSKPKTARLQIEGIVTALDLYRLDVGHYPNSAQGLNALINAPGNERNWNGPYLRKSRIPADPWGADYKYVYPGQKAEIEVVSYGADGNQGGEGDNKDISNWE